MDASTRAAFQSIVSTVERTHNVEGWDTVQCDTEKESISGCIPRPVGAHLPVFKRGSVAHMTVCVLASDRNIRRRRNRRSRSAAGFWTVACLTFGMPHLEDDGSGMALSAARTLLLRSQRQEEEAAALYEGFVASFDADEGGLKTFVRGGTVLPGSAPGGGASVASFE